MMGGRMDRIDLNGSDNIEPGLLETERHAARASEKVDAYGTVIHPENS
jgi:hypothetical protein